MSGHQFGWDLPPGVTPGMIDDAAGYDPEEDGPDWDAIGNEQSMPTCEHGETGPHTYLPPWGGFLRDCAGPTSPFTAETDEF